MKNIKNKQTQGQLTATHTRSKQEIKNQSYTRTIHLTQQNTPISMTTMQHHNYYFHIKIQINFTYQSWLRGPVSQKP